MDPVANDALDPRSASFGTLWRARTPGTGSPAAGVDSELDSSLSDRPSEPGDLGPRWVGWRIGWLIAGAVLGCIAFALLVLAAVSAPHIDATWRVAGPARIELAASNEPGLQTHLGKALTSVAGGTTIAAVTDLHALQQSSRWLVSDFDRARHLAHHEELSAALAAPEIELQFADGTRAALRPTPRGMSRLPLLFWVLGCGGLALFVAGLRVLLSEPSGRHVAYALMAFCQAGNLALMALESTLELGLQSPITRLDMPIRMTLDLLTAAAMVNAACLNPRRLPGSGWIALFGWLFVALLVGMNAAGVLTNVWWWTQGGVIALGLISIGLLSWSYQIEPHPFAIVLQRFTIIAVATWTLLSASLAAANHVPGVPHNVADIASLVWYLFFGSVLLLAPFLAKAQNLLHEFALLAAMSTVATSLDLLFIGVLSLGPFASLTLSVFVSLALYAGARHWILNQLLGSSMLTTERMFEQLYRVAREVEARPERTPALLGQLLGELFEPLEMNLVDRRPRRTRLAGDGSSMLVPVPLLGADDAPHGAVMVRFAQRGRHLFTSEDARLTDRIVEQLRRAVHFDKAVEQGRREERLRLAQDLHDDIGARLLTLMYKAQSPEMEEYVRHTLQDLKTLTRGLAASNHRLSHAAAEWKADLTHRLTAAHVQLKWSFVFDQDVLLTVGHWSALTRVLRELVSNAIAHSQAQHLEIDFRLEGDRIQLSITDDGIGHSPRGWAHGLGLGGVRKRVKQLGGEVEWREAAPHGICCRVIIHELSARP